MNYGTIDLNITLDTRMYNGEKMKREHFKQIKDKIESLNMDNSHKLNLVQGVSGPFPNKFSMDLRDIEKTS